jgi:hypothetical protein
MALPRAFATLGLLLGAVMLAVIFVLSLFTLSALVRWAAAAGCTASDSFTPAALVHALPADQRAPAAACCLRFIPRWSEEEQPAGLPFLCHAPLPSLLPLSEHGCAGCPS